MRLSTRLIANAATTYLRLGTTFLAGIFMTWYVIGEVGLVGFGMLALTMGSMGMSAVDNAIRQSIVRELSAAIATGRAERVQQVLASALRFCGLVSIGMIGFFLALGAVAASGWVFNTPAGEPDLPAVLGWLFMAEGTLVMLGMLSAPYTQAIFAAQRVGVDNALLLAQRLVTVAAALLAFSVIWPDASMGTRLLGYAAVRLALAVLELGFEVVLARRLVPALRFRLGAFNRDDYRAVRSTVWHTGQVAVLTSLSVNGLAVLINLFFGMTYNGIWQVVTQVGGHARMIGLGVLRGIDPLSTHLQERGRRDTILDLMVRTIRYQLLVVLPVAAAYALFLVPILRLWIGGRLARDEHLAAAGVGVEAAIGLAAIMGALNLAAEVLRMSTRGVERMLFGLGEVSAYAWFARYALLITLGGGALLMWATGSPALAPLPLAVANFVYFDLVVLRAAARRTGLPVGEALRRSLPRPLALVALLVLALVPARRLLPELTLPSLVGLLAAIGLATALLTWLIGLEPDERRRLAEMGRKR